MCFLTFHPSVLTPTWTLLGWGSHSLGRSGRSQSLGLSHRPWVTREEPTEQQTGTAKCPLRTARHAHGLQPSFVPWLSGDRVRRLPGGSDRCHPHTCSEPRGLIPAARSTERPAAPRGGAWLHLQVWRMRVARWWRGAWWELKPGPRAMPPASSRGPAGHLPGGRTPGRGPWCPQLPPGQAEQEAEGLGSPCGAPSTHRWHVPLAAPSPGDPHCMLSADGVLVKGPPHREDRSLHPGEGLAPPAWPYLWELAPGDLGGPIGLDHDGGGHLAGPLGAARLIQQVVIGLRAGVQASLPDLLVEAGVWGEGARHLWAWCPQTCRGPPRQGRPGRAPKQPPIRPPAPVAAG